MYSQKISKYVSLNKFIAQANLVGILCSGSRWVSVRFVLHFEHVAFVFCRHPLLRFGKIVILCKDSIDSE